MKNPPHPGGFVLRQCIEPLGLTITDAAAALGVTRTTLSELVNERRGISPEMAVRLSKVFGGSAESWLTQQAHFELAQVHADWINNFWKALARDPATLKRTWESIKQIMAPGALDPLTKEMIYVAVSVTNQCGYCIASHTAAARNKGMTEAMFAELMAVVGMANETNRLAAGYQVEIDEQFKVGAK